MKLYKRTTNKQLGQLLIERGVITHEQLAKTLEYMKEHKALIGELLVELKFATEKDIAQALTCQYGFPYLPLANYEIDAEVINSVPEDVCNENCLSCTRRPWHGKSRSQSFWLRTALCLGGYPGQPYGDRGQPGRRPCPWPM